MFNLFKLTQEDDDQQQDRRPVTRSQSRESTAQLEIPASSIASFNGVARGRRTPSPRPIGHNANSAVFFQYDSTNISQRLLASQSQHTNAEAYEDSPGDASSTADMAAAAQTIEELRASAAAAVEAANAATAALVAAAGLVSQQQQSTQQVRTRKPELPEFDARNVEIWIRRMQSAYDRAGITLPKDKFAFLETKFAVGSNPTIDSFLYGPATEEKWQEFITYLKEEYGRTIRQEAQYIRGQFSRDGRRPSQMLSQIMDKVKRVTVDDILKEIVVSSLPSDVQQMVLERVKDLTAEQTAKLADNYFDQEGRPIHSRAPNIQHVDTPQQDEPQEELLDTEVNAIRGGRNNFRGGRRGYNNNNNAHFSKPFSDNGFSNNSSKTNRNVSKLRSSGDRASPSSHSNSSSSFSASASSGGSSMAPLMCMNHQRYGDKSFTCQQGCSRWPEFSRRQAGNGSAGKRK